MPNKNKEIKWEESFFEELEWLFLGDIIFTGAFGEPAKLNILEFKKTLTSLVNIALKEQEEKHNQKIKEMVDRMVGKKKDKKKLILEGMSDETKSYLLTMVDLRNSDRQNIIKIAKEYV